MFFPPVYVWVKLFKHEHILFNTSDVYRKQTWRNRCRILGPNKVQDLIIPITHASKHNAMQSVMPDHKEPWINHHLKSLQTAYGKSPFYEYYKDDLAILYRQFNNKTLAEINIKSVSFCLKKLRMPADISTVTGLQKINNDHLLNLNSYLSNIYPPKNFMQLPYNQVFGNVFVSGLSILDALFCLGPQAADYIFRHSDYTLEP